MIDMTPGFSPKSSIKVDFFQHGAFTQDDLGTAYNVTMAGSGARYCLSACLSVCLSYNVSMAKFAGDSDSLCIFLCVIVCVYACLHMQVLLLDSQRHRASGRGHNGVSLEPAADFPAPAPEQDARNAVLVPISLFI